MNEIKLKKLLGIRIKHYRNKLGLTQEELGEKIDRTQRQVSLIELGNSFPNPETLTNLIKVFGCTMKELFDFEPIVNIENLREKTHLLIDKLNDENIKIIFSIAKNL